jgi:hypothetical protein
MEFQVLLSFEQQQADVPLPELSSETGLRNILKVITTVQLKRAKDIFSREE